MEVCYYRSLGATINDLAAWFKLHRNSISRIIKAHANRLLALWRKLRIDRVRRRERQERERRENQEAIRRQQAQRWFRMCMHHEPSSPPLYRTREETLEDMDRGYERCKSLSDCERERHRTGAVACPVCGIYVEAREVMCAGCCLTRKGIDRMIEEKEKHGLYQGSVKGD